MTDEKRKEIEKKIKDQKLRHYMCDPSCGLRFILPEDGDHTCPQCNRELMGFGEACVEDFE